MCTLNPGVSACKVCGAFNNHWTLSLAMREKQNLLLSERKRYKGGGLIRG